MAQLKTRQLITLVCLLLGQSLMSQPPRLQSEQFGRAGASFDYWHANDQSITQFALPMMYVYPFSDKVRIYAVTSPAFSSWHTGDADFHLNGLSDIKIGGHVLTLNDEVLVTWGINIPTGKEQLTIKEYAVASQVTDPAFDFRVPSLGQGTDIQIGANTAWELGDFIVGYGINLYLKGSYRPQKSYESIRYEPGNELSVTWGIYRETRLFDRDMKISADMLYSGYGSDEFADSTFFSSGNRMVIQAMSQFKQGSMDIVLLLRNRIKGKNEWFHQKHYDGSHGNQFEIQALGSYPMNPDLTIRGLIDIKLYGNNDSDLGGANIFGLGGGAYKKINQRLTANGEARFYFGRLKPGSDWAGVFGMRYYAGIIYTFQGR
ncbi:hypothetical protein JW835_00195 [bacterium]|nr:hypothetical protein [bacterium]